MGRGEVSSGPVTKLGARSCSHQSKDGRLPASRGVGRCGGSVGTEDRPDRREAAPLRALTPGRSGPARSCSYSHGFSITLELFPDAKTSNASCTCEKPKRCDIRISVFSFARLRNENSNGASCTFMCRQPKRVSRFRMKSLLGETARSPLFSPTIAIFAPTDARSMRRRSESGTPEHSIPLRSPDPCVTRPDRGRPRTPRPSQ